VLSNIFITVVASPSVCTKCVLVHMHQSDSVR